MLADRVLTREDVRVVARALAVSEAVEVVRLGGVYSFVAPIRSEVCSFCVIQNIFRLQGFNGDEFWVHHWYPAPLLSILNR